MQIICLDFIIDMMYGIKNTPIIHNDKMHKSLLQVNKLIKGYIQNDMIEVNDPDMVNF